MGDPATLAKAKLELEQLYLGVPDDSVNLTFQDLATLHPPVPVSGGGEGVLIKKKPSSSHHHPHPAAAPIIMTKLPSLDFSKGLAETSPLRLHQQRQGLPDLSLDNDEDNRLPEHAPAPADSHGRTGSGSRRHLPPDANPHRYHPESPFNAMQGAPPRSNYNDMSNISLSLSMSMVSTASGYRPHEGGRLGGARRPGIPHSNICSLCTTYVYIFRHRCLVCGRAYCRSCVRMGMGDMTEGRKCIECLGRRFSARYIQRAGKVGCCAGYPSTSKQAELKWAERGPRRTSDRPYGRGGSRSPAPLGGGGTAPRTPVRAPPSPSTPASFVMSTSYSPYSPTNPHIPF
ncbi:hypothetical protein MLD38_011495 [Melastoma candidum]|uniref:Uncharacterized protein n=1 Tax=Melastoma candidum TaxID=119954 RepID=A0ACB9R3B6_9MYRT|nr:hypothetical protein MLD38_011495 [Melastoma candidum]